MNGCYVTLDKYHLLWYGKDVSLNVSVLHINTLFYVSFQRETAEVGSG